MIEESVSLSMWKRFVQEGVLDSARLNKRISESWHRCKIGKVNPYEGKGRKVLKGEAWELQKEKNRRLLELTLPQISRLSPFIRDVGMIALVIDPEGYVLSMQGEQRTLQEAHAINFREGVRWTEDEVGTNAIGTALMAGEPIMVNGTEHYSVASHSWSCSAAPIRDGNGTLIGVVDVSAPLARSHPQMMATVSSLAFLIEQEWMKERQRDDLELMRLAVEEPDEEERLWVVCNQDQRVVYASRSVRQAMRGWAEAPREQVRESGFREGIQIPLYSLRHGGLIGYRIELLRSESRVHLHGTGRAVSGLLQQATDSAVSGFQQQATGRAVSRVRFRGEAGTSRAFQFTLREVERIAPSDGTVVIYGESGTGKELIARAIHDSSPRAEGPFVAVNCGAVPRELMESELFGYAEGAFTGARRRGYSGKIVQADGGTLFLDEIGEIPHAMQVALLRVLQERKVTPIGSAEEISVNVRVIAATHRNLRQLVKEGAFREDLYYRLHVLPITVPPLRERKEDIPSLIRHYCSQNGFALELPADVMEVLLAYDWPGNIRELFNVLERMRVSPREEWKRFLLEAVQPECSPGLPPQSAAPSPSPRPLTYREQLERNAIVRALEKSNGSASVAAEMLGIPRSTFYRKLKKYQL
ncbi:transcriptional regulator of acetoin/glycerol metabolism [Brevibacillus aydinogluensis]|jgi:transcriptional regulator of acetoin/glycerol metabolism|uniref:sigma-54-dependent Fis family transcriptional regulator n=1 Tax=Brevibacillus TaxID=55080 RepID=UPI001B9CCEC8|nr:MULTISPECIES: sigma-54-dependent Fis family transcriptional regulator [Brevibacillus]MBR8660546.1 sigma-54-dependent Fis family transcriptional regulator [Brevibacillus sp. NL20B1]MDT3415757.1 transcriptional regulator of acetoin/glycerol metabolism [Brevibacillus aydinogluensis]